ncbi:hypothetical protein BDV23DRAFT_155963 [Aspergillus alliaceus]|uniref:Cytochrome P450 n=1 Tax=Petromyces alliaceus TaxID=209559 RepID=A0A5N7C8M7_PETAA|nr:hypothetical protein BDV23DRAFT_155963 [Aspergillus alliaceus]
MVFNPKGITILSAVHIPKGAIICLPSYSIVRDQDLYSDPDSFKSFRYVERRRH